MSQGYFTQVVQQWALAQGPEEGREMELVRSVARRVLQAGDVQWAGALAKGTAIRGSDLDLWIDTPGNAVSDASRRRLREELEIVFPGREVRVYAHVVRVAASGSRPRVDLSFGNASFGSRLRPDAGEFRGRPDRQEAARALKIWLRSGGLPRVPGWAVEGFVVGADQSRERLKGLGLFLKLVDWLADRANPSAVESVLKPRADPWRPEWSSRLAGPVQALRDAARSLRARNLALRPLVSVADAEGWLRTR